MPNLPRALVTVALLMLPACADDGAVDENVSRGWRATSLALGDQETDWKQSADAEGNVSLELGCTDGGNATIVGRYDGDNEFDVSISFSGCKADDVVISGELAMHAEVEVTDTSSRVSIEYGGELSWSGAAQGSCEIDMSMSIAASVEGSGSDVHGEFDAEFHGEVCGYDADAVMSASAELD